MQILTQLSVWAPARRPGQVGRHSVLSVRVTHWVLGAHFPFPGCQLWLLAHFLSLSGTTQHSCANVVARTDVQLYRVLQKSVKLSLPPGWGLEAVTFLETSDMDPSFFLPVATDESSLWPSYVFPVYRNLTNCKHTAVPVVRKSKANVSAFICVLKWEMKGSGIWNYGQFSSLLCCPQHSGAVWCALTGTWVWT